MQDAHVVDRQVESLRTGWWNRVRGVTGDHEPTPTHRLGDETAEPQQGAVEDRSLFELEPVIAVDPSLQLVPNLLVRPQLDVLVD